MSDKLAEGHDAPDFKMPTTAGRTVTLAAFRGAPLVLYFYPKDLTPGCTTEARDFSGLLAEFTAAGAAVLGVSRDPVSRHETFRDKEGLTVELASDEDGRVCEAYGVWVEKKMYGKSFMGVQRATMLIDQAGRIARLWPKVTVRGHAAALLEAVKSL